MTRHKFSKIHREYAKPDEPLELFGPFCIPQMDGYGKMGGHTLDRKPHYFSQSPSVPAHDRGDREHGA